MPATAKTPDSEAAILNRLICPERDNLPVTAARATLKIEFEESDRDRMRELSQKAREGSLSRDEQVEINSYEVVGHLLDLLHSKARRSLKKHSNGR
jgi:hypothetical protein